MSKNLEMKFLSIKRKLWFCIKHISALNACKTKKKSLCYYN